LKKNVLISRGDLGEPHDAVRGCIVSGSFLDSCTPVSGIVEAEETQGGISDVENENRFAARCDRKIYAKDSGLE